MIYTVTFNPSLDYVIGAEKLEPGKINRTTRENIYPGGKGNNVSVVLSNLGHKSKALGFVSGFTGEALERTGKVRPAAYHRGLHWHFGHDARLPGL